jgi:hypothetical protein
MNLITFWQHSWVLRKVSFYFYPGKGLVFREVEWGVTFNTSVMQAFASFAVE